MGLLMSSDAVIEVRALSKRYEIYNTPRDRLLQFFAFGRKKYFRDFTALNSISFTVRKGETVGIIGRNGSGKSTLLQIIAGVLAPSNGSMIVNGKVAALLELGAGFSPNFTGVENVRLYASILGMSPHEIEKRLPEILKFADIGDFVNQPIKLYSSGMIVRLAFAAAIHVDPDILIVDEALSVGDTAFQQKCLNRIRQMQKSGVSILLVTHSTNTVIEFCDRAIFLRHGELVLDGACRDVARAYSDDIVSSEGGVSSESVNELSASIDMHAVESLQNENQNDAATLIINKVELRNAQGILCAAVQFGDLVFIDFEIQVFRNIQLPCFGIQISSTDGIALWSANTMNMNVRPASMQPGITKLRWCLKANFGGNRYVFALGAGEVFDGEYRRYHRLGYAGHLDVIQIRASGSGWLAPEPKFIIQ